MRAVAAVETYARHDVIFSIEARWGEVVPRGVAEVAPMRIFLDTREGDVSGCRHVGEVQVQRDVAQGGALYLVQRGGIPQPKRKVDHAVLVSPRVHHDHRACKIVGQTFHV